MSSERIDKSINIILAVASSSSIAAWAIWREASWVWATIIAVSQAINAVKVFLPFKARHNALINLTSDLEKLLLDMERRWFDVSEGNLNEQDIHNLQFQMREKKISILRKNLGSVTLPEKSRLFKKAQAQTDVYIEHFYPSGVV